MINTGGRSKVKNCCKKKKEKDKKKNPATFSSTETHNSGFICVSNFSRGYKSSYSHYEVLSGKDIPA